MYVSERVRELLNCREVQVGCDGGRSAHRSGSSVESDGLEGSGNR